MSVQFNEEDGSSLLYARFERSNQTPGMISLIKKVGIAKTDSQALYILVTVIIVLLGVMIFSISTLGSPSIEELPDANLSV
jgi:hypothetical protein